MIRLDENKNLTVNKEHILTFIPENPSMACGWAVLGGNIITDQFDAIAYARKLAALRGLTDE